MKSHLTEARASFYLDTPTPTPKQTKTQSQNKNKNKHALIWYIFILILFSPVLEVIYEYLFRLFTGDWIFVPYIIKFSLYILIYYIVLNEVQVNTTSTNDNTINEDTTNSDIKKNIQEAYPDLKRFEDTLYSMVKEGHQNGKFTNP